MMVQKIWIGFFEKTASLLPEVLWRIFLIIVILAVSFVIIKIGTFIITKIIEKQKRFKFYGNGKKLDTINTIMASMLRYGVYFIAGVTILTNVLKVFNIGTVLAAAGIGGVALGFGAQSLVKDIISGFFILAENQFSVGDIVSIGGLTGTVEEMELRVTRIRNFDGELYIIPNGEIKIVVNHTKGNRLAIVDIKVPYDIKVNDALEISAKVCKLVEQESKVLVEPPQVLGVTELGETNYVVRITAQAIGTEHWSVEREIRRMVLGHFEEEKKKLGVVLPVGEKSNI